MPASPTKRTAAWLMALAALVVLGSPGSATAQPSSARSDSLSASPLHYDETDIFRFPGVIPHYSNLLIMNLSPDRKQGDGGLLFGKGKFVVGFFANRAPLFDDFQGLTDAIAGRGEKDPPRLFDLFGALKLRRGSSIGFGLTLGINFQSQTNTAATRNKETSGAEVMSLQVVAGYSLRARKMKLDVGLELTFNTYKTVTLDEIDAHGSAVPSFALRGRGFHTLSKDMEFGYELLITRRHYAVSVPVHKSGATFGRFLVEAYAGPKFFVRGKAPKPKRSKKLDDDDPVVSRKIARKGRVIARVTGGIILGFETVGGSTSIGGSDMAEALLERAATSFVFPGFHAAAEIIITKTLTARLGFEGRYYFLSSSAATPKMPDPVNSEEPSNSKVSSSTRKSAAEYSWGAGVGWRLGGLVLDGSFQAKLFTDGPDFLGGKGPGLFAMVTAQYHWK